MDSLAQVGLLPLNERLLRAPRAGSRAIDARIEELLREGREVIPLRPYPLRPLPPHIIEAAERAARETVNPPSRGLLEFRAAVADTLSAELSMSIDPEVNVLATVGGMHALFVTFQALLNPGDEVLLPTPCYFLEGIIEPLGGRMRYVPMDEADGYRWNIDRLEASITSATRCIFLNTPVNPSGYVLTRKDVLAIAELAERRNLVVVADESYNTLLYDGRVHVSIASIPEVRYRTVLIRSFTKSFSMPGWRVGYIVAPGELVDAFTKALEWTLLYVGHINQKAAAAALLGPRDWLSGVTEEWQHARDLLCHGLDDTGGLSCVTPSGGPFVFLNVSRFGRSSEQVTSLLLEDYGIPTTPGCYLQSEDHVRMAFGAEPPILCEVLARLKHAVGTAGGTGPVVKGIPL